jgi:hypothetical protein
MFNHAEIGLQDDRVVSAFKPPVDIIHRIAQETNRQPAMCRLPVQLCSPGRTRTAGPDVNTVAHHVDRRYNLSPAGHKSETTKKSAASVKIAHLQPCSCRVWHVTSLRRSVRVLLLWALDICIMYAYDNGMRVVWDPRKASSNRRKHGIRFSDAEMAQERIWMLEASNGLCLLGQIRPDVFMSSRTPTAERTSA